MRRCVAILIIQLVLTSPVGAQISAPANAVSGCYDLTLGEWSPPMPPTHGDSLGLAPPPTIWLKPEPWDHPYVTSGQFELTPAPGSLPSIHRFSHWWFIGADTVHLSWSTGFYGLQAALIARGDTLQGRAYSHSDVLSEPGQIAPITAVRVACDGPRRFPASAERRVPSIVYLASGDSVWLGMTLEATRGEPFGNGRRAIFDAKLAEPYATSTRLEIWANADGVVNRIMFPLPSHERVLRELEAEFGTPTRSSRGRQAIAGTEYESVNAFWETRTLALWFKWSRPLPDGNWEGRALLRVRTK